MVAREKGRILVQVYDRRVGKRIGKTFDRRELAAAKSWKRDTEQAIERGLLRAGECPTFREASAEFMRGAAEGSIRGRSGERFKPSTLRGYEFALRKTLLPRLGSLRLNEIRPGRLAELIGEMQAMGLSAGSVRNRLMPLRATYRWAVQREIVMVNPTRSMQVPHDRGRRDRVASPEEADLLLATLKPEDRALWATAMYAGLRRGELMGLRWQDVDLIAGIVRVERTWHPETKTEGQPKTASGARRVPIPHLLANYLAEQRERTGDQDLVFGHFNHAALRRRAIRRWHAQGIKPISLHECRHSYASMMIAAGVNVKGLSTYLGHASIAMTLDRYGHLMPGNEVEAAGRLQEYIDAERERVAA
jgi:integrase